MVSPLNFTDSKIEVLVVQFFEFDKCLELWTYHQVKIQNNFIGPSPRCILVSRLTLLACILCLCAVRAPPLVAATLTHPLEGLAESRVWVSRDVNVQVYTTQPKIMARGMDSGATHWSSFLFGLSLYLGEKSQMNIIPVWLVIVILEACQGLVKTTFNLSLEYKGLVSFCFYYQIDLWFFLFSNHILNFNVKQNSIPCSSWTTFGCFDNYDY